MAEPRSAPPRRIVIAGGGVAAIETLLALRAQRHGDAFHMTLIARGPDLVYRPLAVGEPFGRPLMRRYRLDEICTDLGALLVPGELTGVDAERRRALMADGGELPYDVLVVATGARSVPPLASAFTFSGEGAPDGYRWVLQDIAQGTTHSVVFVAPPGNGWTLPLYELALQTAQHASSAGASPTLTLVTPEDQPLEVFRGAGSDAVRLLLELVGVQLVTSTYASGHDGSTLALTPGDRTLPADAVVALPTLLGPRLDGVPSDGEGFVRVDEHGHVPGLDDVYAVGDVTSFPIKQGGLATQQADHVATVIAGTNQQARQRPHLRAILLTGGQPLYLTATIAGGESVTSTAARECPWWPPQKIAARHLAPYLADRDPVLASLPRREATAPSER